MQGIDFFLHLKRMRLFYDKALRALAMRLSLQCADTTYARETKRGDKVSRLLSGSCLLLQKCGRGHVASVFKPQKPVHGLPSTSERQETWEGWTRFKNLSWQPFQQDVNDLRSPSSSNVNACQLFTQHVADIQCSCRFSFCSNLPVSAVGIHKRHRIHHLVHSDLSRWQRMSKLHDES